MRWQRLLSRMNSDNDIDARRAIDVFLVKSANTDVALNAAVTVLQQNIGASGVAVALAQGRLSLPRSRGRNCSRYRSRVESYASVRADERVDARGLPHFRYPLYSRDSDPGRLKSVYSNLQGETKIAHCLQAVNEFFPQAVGVQAVTA